MSFMELGHLLTRSGLTYAEVSSKIYRDSKYEERKTNKMQQLDVYY